MGYMTQESLASKLGKSQSSVANKIRLLNLSDDVQEALLENKISERHARSLLRLSTSALQNKMLKRIISERLTVRRTDEEIDKMKNEPSDNDSDESQKVIEKGEIKMNNDINMMPNMTSNPTPTVNFDIFGSPENPQQQMNPFVSAPVQPSYDMGNNTMNVNQAPITPVMPAVEFQPTNPGTESFGMFQTPTTSESTTSTYGFNQFDLNTQISTDSEGTDGGTQFNLNSAVTSVPAIEPQITSPQPITPTMPEIPTMGGIQFDANGTVVSAPEPTPISPVQEIPQFDFSMPVQTMEPQVEIPQVPSSPTGFQFDVNGMVVSAPSTTPTQQTGVPSTSPIIENPTPVQPVNVETSPVVPDLNSTFSFGNTSEVNPNSIQMDNTTYTQPEEIKMPEPIIITDYSKQYDPIMPQTQETIKPVVDFKEVISAIRECSAKIEQYGFKIDLEEYDLANMYQVIFKIEK